MAYIGKSPSSGIRNRFTYTATAGQTTFSGTDDHNKTLSYTDAEFADVFLNGIKLDKSDYTATSGTSIVLDEAATVDDIVEVLAFDTFSVFSGDFSQDVTVGGNVGVTGGLTVDTDTLYVDSTNNKISSGTTTPVDRLHLHSTAAETNGIRLSNSATGSTSSDGFQIYAGSTGQAVLRQRENDSMVMMTNNTSRMTIDSSGNVGIGTTSPETQLMVEQSGTFNGVHNTAGLKIRNAAATTGIGNPYGAITLSKGTGSSAIAAIGQSASDADVTGLAFYVHPSTTGTDAASEAMRIFGNGNVAVGTTADYGKKMVVNQSSSAGAFRVVRTTNVDTTNPVMDIIDGNSALGAGQTMLNLDYDDDTNVDGAYFIRFQDQGGTIGRVEANSSSVSYITTSDYRLKTNVVNYGSAIDKIKNLRPVSFDWVNSGNNDVGFIAHELEEHVPNIVSGVKDAMTTKERADGTTDSVIDAQGVDYGKLTPYLTAALQEAIAKIETLETKVAALEAADV